MDLVAAKRIPQGFAAGVTAAIRECRNLRWPSPRAGPGVGGSKDIVGEVTCGW